MRCLSFLFDGTFLPQCRQTRVRIDVLYYVYVFPLDLVASFYLMKWYRFGSGRKEFIREGSCAEVRARLRGRDQEFTIT
jgi:hypothetical protein